MLLPLERNRQARGLQLAVCKDLSMPALDTVAADRLDRLLLFLSVSGGAALVCKRTRRVIAAVGEPDEPSAIAALAIQIQPPDTIVHATTGVVAEVGLHHRLFVCVPSQTLDPTFGHRIRRARDIIERFALHTKRSPPSPPTSTPAHAVVFPPSGRRRV